MEPLLNGHIYTTCPCDTCTARREAEAFDGASPDIYAIGLATLRAATATDATRFADAFRAAGLRHLDTESAEVEANPLPRLPETEVEEYAAPDPYAAGIRQLQETRR